jgi:plastocyanin
MNAIFRLGSAVGAAALLLLSSGTALAQDNTSGVAEQPMAFAPKELHVTAGTTVVWTNSSDAVHTVTADDSLFDSGDQNPGDVFQWTFAEAGTYQYFCQYHGAPNLTDMAGAIVVS